MRERFRRILDTCQPYLVASSQGCANTADTLPLGLKIADELRFDPHRVKSGPFLHILQRLDDLTFGPVGMPMPRWVFYDCAEVPGGIFGFAREAAEVPLWARRALHVDDDYRGPLPLSMYVAIPMIEPGCWHTYTLCSLNLVSPGAGPVGLGLLTAGCALEVFGIETAVGVAQWRSPKLSVHARFGPLDLVTAWTPAHSDPTTLTFRYPVSTARIERALAADDPCLYDDGGEYRWLDCDEHDDLRRLQEQIESGRCFQVIGGPVTSGSYTRIPIREIDSP